MTFVQQAITDPPRLHQVDPLGEQIHGLVFDLLQLLEGSFPALNEVDNFDRHPVRAPDQVEVFPVTPDEFGVVGETNIFVLLGLGGIAEDLGSYWQARQLIIRFIAHRLRVRPTLLSDVVYTSPRRDGPEPEPSLSDLSLSVLRDRG
ncbi:MAG: hypothetical protein QOG16_1335 [Actinomycetota bacterium]|nr:hypothetical protein [Actinomycetota bacterium]